MGKKPAHSEDLAIHIAKTTINNGNQELFNELRQVARAAIRVASEANDSALCGNIARARDGFHEGIMAIIRSINVSGVATTGAWMRIISDVKQLGRVYSDRLVESPETKPLRVLIRRYAGLLEQKILPPSPVISKDVVPAAVTDSVSVDDNARPIVASSEDVLQSLVAEVSQLHDECHEMAPETVGEHTLPAQPAAELFLEELHGPKIETSSTVQALTVPVIDPVSDTLIIEHHSQNESAQEPVASAQNLEQKQQPIHVEKVAVVPKNVGHLVIGIGQEVGKATGFFQKLKDLENAILPVWRQAQFWCIREAGHFFTDRLHGSMTFPRCSLAYIERYIALETAAYHRRRDALKAILQPQEMSRYEALCDHGYAAFFQALREASFVDSEAVLSPEEHASLPVPDDTKMWLDEISLSYHKEISRTFNHLHGDTFGQSELFVYKKPLSWKNLDRGQRDLQANRLQKTRDKMTESLKKIVVRMTTCSVNVEQLALLQESLLQEAGSICARKKLGEMMNETSRSRMSAEFRHALRRAYDRLVEKMTVAPIVTIGQSAELFVNEAPLLVLQTLGEESTGAPVFAGVREDLNTDAITLKVEQEKEHLPVTDRETVLLTREAEVTRREHELEVLSQELHAREATVKDSEIQSSRHFAEAEALFDLATREHTAAAEIRRLADTRARELGEWEHRLKVYQSQLDDLFSQLNQSQVDMHKLQVELDQREQMAASVEAANAIVAQKIEAGRQGQEARERVLMSGFAQVEADKDMIQRKMDELESLRFELETQRAEIAEERAALSAEWEEIEEARAELQEREEASDTPPAPLPQRVHLPPEPSRITTTAAKKPTPPARKKKMADAPQVAQSVLPAGVIELRKRTMAIVNAMAPAREASADALAALAKAFPSRQMIADDKVLGIALQRQGSKLTVVQVIEKIRDFLQQIDQRDRVLAEVEAASTLQGGSALREFVRLVRDDSLIEIGGEFYSDAQLANLLRSKLSCAVGL